MSIRYTNWFHGLELMQRSEKSSCQINDVIQALGCITNVVPISHFAINFFNELLTFKDIKVRKRFIVAFMHDNTLNHFR
jgi:hypothetical protein